MLNKTPKKQPSVTVLAPKNPLGLWLGGALIVFGFFAVVQGIVGLTDNKTRLISPGGSITIEIPDNNQSRSLGLSGRESIGKNEGMMFIFDETKLENCFWMKDMKFSIDMIWLNDNREVVTVIENVAPETYPEQFCPNQPAKYGLEVGSGRAGELEIVDEALLRW